MGLFSSLFKRSNPDRTTKQARMETGFDRSKVYPWVKVVFESDDHKEPGPGPFPINRPLIGDLHEFLVLDRGHSFQVIFDRDLPADLSVEELFKLARHNLAKDTSFSMNILAPNCEMIIAGGNHEAGALCLPQFWADQSARLGGDLLVFALAKDLVVLAPAHDQAAKSELHAVKARTSGKLERALSDLLFRYHASTATWSVEASL
jgi:hypothetical protein